MTENSINSYSLCIRTSTYPIFIDIIFMLFKHKIHNVITHLREYKIVLIDDLQTELPYDLFVNLVLCRIAIITIHDASIAETPATSMTPIILESGHAEKG